MNKYDLLNDEERDRLIEGAFLVWDTTHAFVRATFDRVAVRVFGRYAGGHTRNHSIEELMS